MRTVYLLNATTNIRNPFLQARELLESLIATNHSFSSLTFNLSTIYELCSDKSRVLKMGLAEKLAKQPRSGEKNWEKPNVDFKL